MYDKQPTARMVPTVGAGGGSTPGRTVERVQLTEWSVFVLEC